MMELRAITGEDIPRLIALYERFLNGGGDLGGGIQAAWDRGEYIGTVAEADREIAALFTMRRGLEFTCPHPDLEAEVRAAAGGRDIYTSDALLVLPEYRCEGIAHRLVADTVRQLRAWARTPGVVMTEIWIYPDGRCPAKEPLETMGRIFYQKRVPGFYRDLARYGITCPICGENCVCGAWVDVADVWGEDT